MEQQPERSRRRPTLEGLISTSLVFLGILLGMTVDMSLLILAGLGAFGPGMLRELGWLKDQDEFQREAAYRAGYHAYLVGGFVAVLVVAALQFGTTTLDGPVQYPALVLVSLWLVWLFSGLQRYWGARKTASRVLLAFGSFWALFVVASHLTQPAALLGESLVVLPFFVLAYTASRWPRTTGVLLVVASVGLFVFLFSRRPGDLVSPATLLTLLLLFVPLMGSGIMLLRETVVELPEVAEAA